MQTVLITIVFDLVKTWPAELVPTAMHHGIFVLLYDAYDKL